MLLSTDQIETKLSKLTDWTFDQDQNILTKTITTTGFSYSAAVVQEIAASADAANHHPDVCLHAYKKLTIELKTHDEGGVTEKDFEMAKQIDQILSSYLN